MKRPFPTQCSLELEVYATRDAMGKAAAQDAKKIFTIVPAPQKADALKKM